MIKRRETRVVDIGGLKIGGKNPILIQSMTNTQTVDALGTGRQIAALTLEGCEIARVAVPDEESARSVREIKRHIDIPLIADVHFDYRLALLCMQNGADKLRINPGNIGREHIGEVARVASKLKIPIRIGVNGGSLDRRLLEKHGGVTAEALTQSAIENTRLLEAQGFYEIVMSVKTSNVPLTIEAYKLLSEMTDYPLHIGVTESGLEFDGIIKSAVGLGAILYSGIGDTLRVSLTGDPLEEIKAAKGILSALGIRRFGPEIVSCPTCGRTRIDLVTLTEEVHRLCAALSKAGKIGGIKIAVMGCAVNGPGEAKDADVGVAGGDGRGVIFRRGEVVASVEEREILAALEKEITALYGVI